MREESFREEVLWEATLRETWREPLKAAMGEALREELGHRGRQIEGGTIDRGGIGEGDIG